jgi:hypothetical protein
MLSTKTIIAHRTLSMKTSRCADAFAGAPAFGVRAGLDRGASVTLEVAMSERSH